MKKEKFRKASGRNSIIALMFLMPFVLFSFGVEAAEKESAEKIELDKNWVSVPILNVRSAPATDTEVIDRLEYGTLVDVVSAENDWFSVKIEDKEGWIYAPLVKNTYEATINADEVELRADKDIHAEVLSQLNQEQSVLVLSEDEDWAFIDNNGQKGWVFRAYINRGTRKVWVDASSLNVRSKASLNSLVLGKVVRGDEVYVIQEDGDWSEITGDGVSGWVASIFLNDQRVQPVHASSVNPRVRHAYLEENSHIPHVIKKSIETGTFKIGMNKDQIKASIGEPSTIVNAPQNYSATEQWIYESGRDRTVLNFTNDYLSSWGKEYPVQR